MEGKAKIREIIKRLKKEYPETTTALHFSNPFELLVATILSAQATDALVNRVTDELFKKYRTVRDYATVPVEKFRTDVSSVNFYRNKSKSILATAKKISDEYGGKVPNSMEELVKLPGVARKTANIILYNAFGKNEGVAVDTHVKRLSQRLGLSKHDDPLKIEQDLMKNAVQNEWGTLSHLLIFHGRAVCKAKNPLHEKCVLYDICPSNSI